jgi:hypothetical protein
MFLRIEFKNYGSFRDTTEMSFIATRIKDDDVHTPRPSKGSFAKFGVLPVLALYGANASGKSTALEALKMMASHVLGSHTLLKLTDKIPYKPYKLDAVSSIGPATFDCDLLIENVRYHYGFLYTRERFEEEWLYAWPNGSQQLWFHRKGNDRDAWYFGPALKGDRKRIAAATRENALFLSAAAQLNHEQLGKIYRAFGEQFMPDLPWDAHKPMMFSESPLFDPQRRDEVQRLLRAADLGVTDFRIKSHRTELESYIAHLQESGEDYNVSKAKEFQAALESNGEPKQLELMHEGVDGIGFWLDPDEESDGTISIINRLHQTLSALSAGALVLIDELDRSLHPQLCAELIKLFTNPRSNRRGAQLVFSTHDVSLMEHLRRDEVLLTEKKTDGSSHLVAMSQFKLLRRDDMARVYMEGRVGGLPLTGSLSNMLKPDLEVG